MSRTLKIMVVAGEASGDAHAAKLARALEEARPDIKFEFFGSAGPKMRQAGVVAVVRADDLAIVGLLEIAASLPKFISAFSMLKKAAKERRPDAVILVDFPEFNLKLARTLKRLGLPVVYYISPQLWAWRQRRVRVVKESVDLMLTILPFEKDWYKRHEVDHVEYVGSPLAREVHPNKQKADFCREHYLVMDKPLIALLPGSRRKEIVRILPVMLESVAVMKERDDSIQFVIALADDSSIEGVKAAMDESTAAGFDDIRVVTTQTYDALNAADAAAVTSGTATLEAGIIGTPMVVVYKVSHLNYAIFEPMIDVEHYGLINLIAGKRVAKELIHKGFTAETLSAELIRLLQPQVNSDVREELRIAADKLGRGGASRRAAEAVLGLIQARSPADHSVAE